VSLEKKPAHGFSGIHVPFCELSWEVIFVYVPFMLISSPITEKRSQVPKRNDILEKTHPIFKSLLSDLKLLQM
jgi:hypothetical protein